MKKKPQHVAIIMDGNGRWARSRGLPALAGHRAGAGAVRRAVEAARELGLSVLTLYAFSTENWKRPRREIEGLFKLLEQYLDGEADKLDEHRIRLSVIGRIDALPPSTREKIKVAIGRTRRNTGLVLNLALNYGGRQEIVDAARLVAAEAKAGALDEAALDEDAFARHLYTAGLPDVDLLIRTSGEQRLSNFLLWQVSYAEFYFLKKMWPDFRKSDLEKALREYETRERRFGG